MRARRCTLPAALAALTLGLATLTTPAMADDAATLSPARTVTFRSGSEGQVDVTYACSVLQDGNPAQVSLAGSLVQTDPTGASSSAAGDTAVSCDGVQRTVTVPLATADGLAVVAGPATLDLRLADQSFSGDVTVVRSDLPADTATLFGPQGNAVFTSPTTGSVTFGVSCTGRATQDLAISLATDDGNQVEGTAPVVCDGTQQAVDVRLAVTAGPGVGNGPANLWATIGGVTDSFDVTVALVTLPPPPVQHAQVTLTANASPEKVVKGKKITITGTARRDGKKVSLKTTLEFRADGGDYARVKKVTSSKKGSLKTTVKASRSGSFRFRYAGSATTDPATSSGDHIDVTKAPKPLPKPKTYKNCTALNKVYPHGVGKKGAHDKGGSVTSFTVDDKTYAKNKKSDRDKDGIACEKR